MPKRIQMKRTKGWRKPEGAIYVGRPTRWGNPYSVADLGRDDAINRYRELYTSVERGERPEFPLPDLAELRGHDLGCWCKVTEACHADVLLQKANQ